MSILLVRHSFSAANDRNNVGGLAFAAEQAPLLELGREQARGLSAVFLSEYDIVPAEVPAATSELLRTQQTAQEAGFRQLVPYAHLDEVKHGMDLLELRAMLDRGELPRIALKAARDVLENPPQEKVWFTHGLRIAGICALLGVHQEKRLIPRFCEIRELTI